MRRADSLEKTLMLGKIEGRRRRGRQRVRWLDGTTDSTDTNLSKLRELVRTGKPGGLQSTGSQRAEHTWATDWTTAKTGEPVARRAPGPPSHFNPRALNRGDICAFRQGLETSLVVTAGGQSAGRPGMLLSHPGPSARASPSPQRITQSQMSIVAKCKVRAGSEARGSLENTLGRVHTGERGKKVHAGPSQPA